VRGPSPRGPAKSRDPRREILTEEEERKRGRRSPRSRKSKGQTLRGGGGGLPARQGLSAGPIHTVAIAWKLGRRAGKDSGPQENQVTRMPTSRKVPGPGGEGGAGTEKRATTSRGRRGSADSEKG